MNWTDTSWNISMNSSDGKCRNEQSLPTYYQEPFVLLVVRLFFICGIFLVGLLGNFLVCYVIIRDKLYRSMTYCFVLNLAVADLGLLILSLPLGMFRIEDISWPAGEFACKVLYPLGDIFQGGAIATITAIAFFRFRGIVSGQLLEPRKAFCQALVVIVLIWPFSFLLFVVPLFFLMKFNELPGGRIVCFPKFPSTLWLRLYNILTLLLLYLLPLALVLFTYVRIRRRLFESINLHSRMQTELGRKAPDHVAVLNHRALRILTPVVIVFAVTMLPYNFLRLLDVLDSVHVVFGEYNLLYFKLCILFFVCNSSANPVIYPFVCDDFRRGFKRHLQHWFSGCRGKPILGSSVMRNKHDLIRLKVTASSPRQERQTAISSVWL